MFKHKKIVSAILAVVMIGAMSTSVFADGSDSTGPVSTDYGVMNGYNTVSHSSGNKFVTVSTTCLDAVPTIWVQLGVVAYPSGSQVYPTKSNQKSNNVNVYLTTTLQSEAAVTSYGGHQIIGAQSWGRYTTVVNA